MEVIAEREARGWEVGVEGFKSSKGLVTGTEKGGLLLVLGKKECFEPEGLAYTGEEEIGEGEDEDDDIFEFIAAEYSRRVKLKPRRRAS